MDLYYYVAIITMSTSPPQPSARRFYNAALRDVYSACVLPTERLFTAAAHAVQRSVYMQRDICRSIFTHTECVLPPGHPRPPPYSTPLSLPFYSSAHPEQQPAPSTTAVDQAASKRRKQNDMVDEQNGKKGDGGCAAGDERDDKKEERKAAPFTRKAPLDGQLQIGRAHV